MFQKHKTKSQSPCAQKDKCIPEEDGVWPKKIKKQQKFDIEKANGPDSIAARVLKQIAPELYKQLAKLFQLCFNKGIMPKSMLSPATKRNIGMARTIIDQYLCSVSSVR